MCVTIWRLVLVRLTWWLGPGRVPSPATMQQEKPVSNLLPARMLLQHLLKLALNDNIHTLPWVGVDYWPLLSDSHGPVYGARPHGLPQPNFRTSFLSLHQSLLFTTANGGSGKRTRSNLRVAVIDASRSPWVYICYRRISVIPTRIGQT